MRRTRSVFLFCLLLCFGCNQSKNEKGYSNMSTLEFNTEKIVGEWVKSWNTYDLNKVDRLFLQESNLTYFSSEKEGVLIGIEAIREHHKGFGFVKGGKDQPNKLWVEDLHTAKFNSAVIVTGIWFFQREDGSKQRGPVTIVYVRVNDDYRIAHMNFSNYINTKEMN